MRNRTPLTISNSKTSQEPKHITGNETGQTNASTSTNKNRNKSKIFAVKDRVVYRAEGNTKVKWKRAIIVERLSTCRYKIRLLENDTIRICHGDQLRMFNTAEHSADCCVTPTLTHNAAANAPSECTTTEPTSTPTRVSSRLLNKDKPNYHEPRVRKTKRKGIARIRSRSAGDLFSAVNRSLPISPPN